MSLLQTPAWWQSPALWVVGAVVVACGIFAALWKGLPQQTIASLKDATDAGGKVQTAQGARIAQLEKQNAELSQERDGFKSDVARLLREAMCRLDIEAADKKAIERLTEAVAAKEETEIELRLKLADVLKQLNDERGSHGN